MCVGARTSVNVCVSRTESDAVAQRLFAVTTRCVALIERVEMRTGRALVAAAFTPVACASVEHDGAAFIVVPPIQAMDQPACHVPCRSYRCTCAARCVYSNVQ